MLSCLNVYPDGLFLCKKCYTRMFVSILKNQPQTVYRFWIASKLLTSDCIQVGYNLFSRSITHHNVESADSPSSLLSFPPMSSLLTTKCYLIISFVNILLVLQVVNISIQKTVLLVQFKSIVTVCHRFVIKYPHIDTVVKLNP